MKKTKKNHSPLMEGYNRKYDLLLLFISLGFIYILIQGSFYTYSEEKNYNQSKERILKSNRLSFQQKKELEIKSKKDIRKIKNKWGYFFAFDEVLWGSIYHISKYPDARMLDIIYNKQGLLGLSLYLMSEQSNESAVILIPINDDNLNDPNYSISFIDQNYTLKSLEKNKKYFNWFTYPRKIVFLTNEDKDKLDGVTHVYTFNNQGLNFAAVNNPKPWEIYPIRK